MKTQKQWVWRLVAALGLAALAAGCCTKESSGGTGTAYQGTGYGNEYQYGYEWNAPGPPYEWQHPSPRAQMTP